MTPDRLRNELRQTGQVIAMWRAQLATVTWVVVIIGCLCVFGLSDVLLQFERTGRLSSWVILMGLAIVGVRSVLKTTSRRQTVEGVAAVVEHSFPELDNHLINYLQFAANSEGDAFKQAYVRRGVPEWRKLNIGSMKNRRRHRHRHVILAAAATLLLLPCAVTGRPWTVALWRIVNPFSNCPPVTLTKIISVNPGSTSVLQGNPLVVACKVEGYKGHGVRLDVDPADNERTTYKLGRVTGTGVEDFSYRLQKIATSLKYRFRAGDAPPSQWFEVETRPRLAFTAAELIVTPPSDTRLRPRTFDGLAGEVEVPQNSRVTIALDCNIPATAVSIAAADEPVSLTGGNDGHTWRGEIDVGKAPLLRILASGEFDDKAETSIILKHLPGREPVITVLEPKEQPLLKPEIAAKKEKSLQARAYATLDRLIETQRTNLARTRRLVDILDETEPDQWRETAARQKQIRQLARQLLKNPLKPLGGLTPAVQKLYMQEMLEVINELGRIPDLAGVIRTRAAAKGVALEQTILRRLTFAGVTAVKTERQRKISGLLATLEGIIKGESRVTADTAKLISRDSEVDQLLVDNQDDLAIDLADFISTCRDNAPSLQSNDRSFAELILKAAGQCETLKVRRDMLSAAEELEANAPRNALPLEQSALAKLEGIRKLFDKWQVTEAEVQLEQVVEALHDAGEKIGRMKKLQTKLIDAMAQVRPNANKDTAEAGLMKEELEEVQQNTREALLQVANDLHIFPELAVANELVEDIVTMFEEVNQVTGSEDLTEEDVKEIAYLKPEFLIEEMAKAEGRMDEMEMWLGEKPDTDSHVTESFDTEEMPEMALGALPDTLEDLIGDLLEEAEEMAGEADDSATNQNVPDMPPGWEVGEGPTASFGAQGKSGNQRPDHKEQSGRSLVGRQGMSNGETAAGSGTISQGDENIEKRMTDDPTQSGQVQADGEADEVATGGGKLGTGSADEVGMAGKGSAGRMDSTAQGSIKGLESLMAKTQALHIKASLLNLRTESLAVAAHHMRQIDDAIARGVPIHAIREHQRRTIAALKKAETELSGAMAGRLSDTAGVVLDDAVAGATDEAPAEYHELVAEYFKSLSEIL